MAASAMGAADDMKTFQDRNGKAWRIELSFALWRRIKAETEIDLLDVAMPDGKALRQLAEMENVGVVLWLYCEAQAVEAGIDRETFWMALHGDAIETGMKAIVDDLEDFSRSPQFTALRVSMEEAVEKMSSMRARIEDPSGEIRTTIREAFAGDSPPLPPSPSTPGTTPASVPASSAATPISGDSATSSEPPRDPDTTPGSVQV